jgi:hypothetical protein
MNDNDDLILTGLIVSPVCIALYFVLLAVFR